MLWSIINVEGLKATCWLKCGHVKKLSKKSKHSEMWREKEIKSVSMLLRKGERNMVITFSHHGMATYGQKGLNLD